MTSEEKRNTLIIGAIALAAYLLFKPAPAQAVEVRTETEPAESPDNGEWIPGANNPQIVFGPSGVPFIVVGGDTTINVPDIMLGSLSRQYIPMFGFAGVTAIGAQ